MNLMDLDRLKQDLASNSIDFDAWEKVGGKNIHHLLKEINGGESRLCHVDGKLTRFVCYLDIGVWCRVGPRVYFLTEECQLFASGHRNVRKNIQGSLAEKLRHNEFPDENAVRRALSEELGVQKTDRIRLVSTAVRDQNSPGYTGLQARFVVYNVEVWIPESEFMPEGYTEVQEDKTTFFTWE